MTQRQTIGFIGLGVMGEPICRNIATGSGARVVAHDISRAPLERLAADGVEAAGSLQALIRDADIVMLSLPGGPEVQAIIAGSGGVLAEGHGGQVVVDLSTTPVHLTRDLAAALAAKDIRFADAPVARTRQAAIDGTLSIMVGAEPELFAEIRPLLEPAASEITHCGPVGCGQAVKILNNMILFQTGVALAEALAIGKGAGVDPHTLFETLTRGSADSFALRNHGMKAMLPDAFPRNAFSTDYAIKDADYALMLAGDAGVAAEGAALARTMLQRASDAGLGADYWPVIARIVKGATGTGTRD